MKKFLLLFGFIILNLNAIAQSGNPGPLLGSFVAPSSAHLTWTLPTPISNVYAYRVEYRVSGITTWSTSTTLANTTTSWDHTGLTAGTTYEYRLMSNVYTGPGSSGWYGSPTPEVTITVPAATPPPAAPVASVTNVTQTTATINWNDVSTETGYKVYLYNALVATLPANTTTFSFGSLQPYQVYSAYVVAFNSGGSVNSNVASFKTLQEKPRPPKSLKVYKNCNGIGLTWIDDSWDPGQEDYFIIERSTDGANFSQINVAQRDATEFTDVTVNDGTNYWYRVTGYNAVAGAGFASNVVMVTTLAKVAPNAPYDLKAYPRGCTAGETTIDLAWSTSSEDFACNTNIRFAQEIWYNIDGNGWQLLITLGKDVSAFTVYGLSPAQNYNFKIAATNAKGKSYSNVAYARTKGTRQPSDLKVTPSVDASGANVAALTWKDNANNEDRFYIEAGQDSASFKQIAIIKKDLTSFTISPVKEGVTTLYRIRSSYECGYSPYSNTATLFVAYSKAPNAPFDLRAALNGSKVVLTWQDDSDREAGFEVERSTDNKTFAKIATAPMDAVMWTDTVNKSGYYRVRAVNTKGNSAYSNVASVGITSSTITNPVSLAKTSIDVYPNPTTDVVKVDIPEELQQETVKVSVVDGMSRQVLSTILKKGAAQHTIDVSHLPEGSYSVIISTETQKISKNIYKY